MGRFVLSRLLPLVPLSALLFAVQALAQFEVAPDHFDSDVAKPAARQLGAKAGHTNAPPASLDGAGVQGRSQRRAALGSASRRAVISLPSASAQAGKAPPSSAAAILRRKQKSSSRTVASVGPAQGSVP
jgi:hypothetical protein